MGTASPPGSELFKKNCIDHNEVSITSVANHNCLLSTQLQEYYKEHPSDFRSWDQLSHCEQYILFPESMDSGRSILHLHDFLKNIPNIPNRFQQSPINRDFKGLGIVLGIVLECEGLKKLFLHEIYEKNTYYPH